MEVDIIPVVKTLHSILVQKQSRGSKAEGMDDISQIITRITNNVLKGSPGLVADVANGLVDKELLKKEVIKDIDRNRYCLGIRREKLIKKIFDYMFGYGELQEYIDDDDVSDIDGTRYNEFVIKKNGRRIKIPADFGSEMMFATYCNLIAIRNGGILNENDCHCRITDEKKRLRINITIPPRSLLGPVISIRKHRINSYGLDRLLELGMIDGHIKNLILDLCKNNSSILFSGRGAAGKTTLLRALINALPEMERVMIAESDAEIFPDKPFCIQQRVKKRNQGGKKETLKDIVRDGLTMSLDCFCVGEITGDEAWEFVRAAYTGHRGLATTHAESAWDALERLLTLSKGAGIGESEDTIRCMLGKSIDFVFHLTDFKVVEIIEVKAFDVKSKSYIYKMLYKS